MVIHIMPFLSNICLCLPLYSARLFGSVFFPTVFLWLYLSVCSFLTSSRHGEIGEHFVSDTQLIAQMQSPRRDSGGGGGGGGGEGGERKRRIAEWWGERENGKVWKYKRWRRRQRRRKMEKKTCRWGTVQRLKKRKWFCKEEVQVGQRWMKP